MSIWVYLTDNLPFEDFHQIENIEERIMGFDAQKEIQKLRETVKISDELVDLLEGALRKDPSERLKFAQILEHKWFEGKVEINLSTEEDLFA